MVVGDIRDHRQQRSDDVGGIEPASHAGLHHCDVHVLGGEPVEGHHHGEFEERWFSVVACLPEAADEVSDAFFRYHVAVYPHPFAEVHKVRRCVETGSVSLFLKYGGHQVRHAPFAVGPGHVDGAEAAVRVAEIVIERDAAFKPRFVGGCADA